MEAAVEAAGLQVLAKACADLHEKGRVAWLRRCGDRGLLGPSSRAATAPWPPLLPALPLEHPLRLRPSLPRPRPPAPAPAVSSAAAASL